MPLGFPSFSEGLRAGAEIFHALRSILKGRGLSTGVGDEGGFAPSLSRIAKRWSWCSRLSARPARRPATNVFIALDVAASEFWARSGKYVFKKSGEPTRDPQGMVDLYVDWCRQYPIISIEDGCAEQDWHGWKLLTQALGDKVQLVGDDVFVTNPAILRKGIEEKIGNALLVKVNQIGTITETLDAMAIATKAGYRCVSHIARAKPRTRRSLISRSAPRPARSRPAPRRAAIASRNTTSCSESKRNWARRPGTPDERPSSSCSTSHGDTKVNRSHVIHALCQTMHKLVLLRHGESTWNKENRFTGWTDVDLTDKGRERGAQRGAAAEKGRLRVRLRLHLGAEARDLDERARARRARSAVAARRARLALERAPLRRAAGAQQGGNRREARRGPGQDLAARLCDRRRRR